MVLIFPGSDGSFPQDTMKYLVGKSSLRGLFISE